MAVEWPVRIASAQLTPGNPGYLRVELQADKPTRVETVIFSDSWKDLDLERPGVYELVLWQDVDVDAGQPSSLEALIPEWILRGGLYILRLVINGQRFSEHIAPDPDPNPPANW